MSTDPSADVVRRVISRAWNAGDLAVLDECVAPDYLGTDPSFPAPIEGPAGFGQWVTAARTAFPDFRVEIEELIADGDRVAGRITMTGTHSGELMGLPATGRAVSFTGMFVRHLREGRFVRGWDLADTAALMQQLGVTGQQAPQSA